MTRSLIAGLLLVTALAIPAGDARAHAVGCPPGQAIRGIDFLTQRLVSVGAADIAALETAVLVLQGRVTALEAENVAQAAAIASLQAQLAPLLAGTFASPDGQYVITVANSGITLAGPGVSVALNADNPGATPTVEVAGTDVVVIGDRNVGIASGVATNLTSAGDTNVDSGLTTNVSSSAATTVISGTSTTVSSAASTSLQGFQVRLNGGCAAVARVDDLVVQLGPLFRIDTGSPTVSSC
jgi:hypothetical protein